MDLPTPTAAARRNLAQRINRLLDDAERGGWETNRLVCALVVKALGHLDADECREGEAVMLDAERAVEIPTPEMAKVGPAPFTVGMLRERLDRVLRAKA